MTLEELKKEAKKLGYNVVPDNKKPKLLPCICGYKRRDHLTRWDNTDHILYEVLACPKCGRKAEGKNERDAIRNWNRMIEEESWH